MKRSRVFVHMTTAGEVIKPASTLAMPDTPFAGSPAIPSFERG
jgi:hypothetical protein